MAKIIDLEEKRIEHKLRKETVRLMDRFRRAARRVEAELERQETERSEAEAAGTEEPETEELETEEPLTEEPVTDDREPTVDDR